MEDNGRRYRTGAKILKWLRAGKGREAPAQPSGESQSPPLPATRPDVYAPDYTIRVLESDLYDPAINLIERVIWDESELHESMAAPPENPEERAKASGFVDLLLEQTGGLGHKLAEVAGRVEAGESARGEITRKVRAALDEIEALKLAAAETGPAPVDRGMVDELMARVEEIREDYAGRAELDGVSSDLTELRDRAAERSAVDELARRIEEIKDGAAPAGRVEALARELEELKGTAVDQGGLDALSARLDEVGAGLGQERLGELEAEVGRIKEAYVARAELEKISADLAELRGKYTGRALLDKVHDHLEVAGSRFAERTQLNGALESIAEIAARYADRETLDTVAAAVEEIKSNYAERARLEELTDRVARIAERYAERESLVKVKAELKDLGEAAARKGELEQALARIEELAAKYADRAELDAVRDRLEEVGAGAAERPALERLAGSVEGLRSMLEETRRTQQSLLERPEPAALPEGVAERIAGLERGIGELNALAAQSLMMTDLESRVSGLERGIGPAPAAAGEKEAAAPGLAAALERMAEIERRHEELGRKVVEALKRPAAPGVEIEGLRKKLAGLELALRNLPPPRPRSRTWAQQLQVLTGSRLLVVLAAAFVAALAVGTIAAFWSSESAGAGWSIRGKQSSTEAAAPADAPNAIYDDAKPPLSTPTLDMGAEWLTLKDGKVDITGYAPGAARAFLYLNNREMTGTTVENQGFRFSRVPLDYGVNVIEVKVKDDAGNEANSMAGIVERESTSMARVRADSVANRMRGPHELPFIAITFDAGASDQRASKILDVLREKGIVTTFFLTGQFIEKYPDIVKRIVAEGHEAGNHTYNHPHLTTYEQNRHHYTRPGVTREFLQGQLLRTKEMFESLTGAKMAPYWRAPYGEYNSDILAWAQQAGFKHIDWTRTPQNLDMLDWIADEHHRHYLDGQGLLRRLTGIDNGVPGQANGGIILMHLGSDRRRDFLDQVLPQAIDTLRSRNYKFVTVSRMFSRQ